MVLIASRLVKIPLAIMLDDILGEPSILHPVSGFGWLAQRTENLFHPGCTVGVRRIRTNVLGALALLVLVAPPVILTRSLLLTPVLGKVFDIALLYLCIAPRSLTQHAEAVYLAMSAGDLKQSRHLVSRIVSRDTGGLNFDQISAATVESVLENGSDAIFGALFWYFVGGAPLAILYRLVNTLDAMWGYKNARYQDFGWAAARLDDLINWLPARLTALSYAAMGDTSLALHCWRKQARAWYSPNAGPVMAAGAGALAVQLGGDAVYGGVAKSRPQLGLGHKAKAEDIPRAVKLVKCSLQLWSLASTLGSLCLFAASSGGLSNLVRKQFRPSTND